MTKAQIDWAELSAVIAEEGPFLAGAGPVADLHPHFHFGPGVQLDRLTHGISLAYPLSEPVIEECEKGPTVLYKHHYRQVNMLLDRAALRVQGFIQSRGGAALPVPASVFSEWATQAAHLSHKMIALRSGVGWIGKNILLITPEWGARVRLVSILTDVPLESPPRPRWECGPCKRCASVCPVSAIGDKKEDFNLAACSDQCREFERKGMSVRICGICVRACKPGMGRRVAEDSP